MASLREEVESFIASDLAGACEPEYGIVYEKLRAILDRHTPAPDDVRGEGVVVPRELLERLRDSADTERSEYDYASGNSGIFPEAHERWRELSNDVTEADAILSNEAAK
jgi:hypothetical protein